MSSSDHPSFNDPTAYVYYRYHPSFGAAVVFVILFLISTILHTYQMFTKKSWYFTPFLIAGCFEFIGYIGRILSSKDQWSLSPYILQTLLLLVAPSLFAASIYMTLGRIIQLVDGERSSLIPKRWLTKVFVTGDVISFLLQGGGGGMMSAGSLSMLHLGEKIVIVGLFVQIVFFGFFLVVAVVFHRRIVAKPTLSSGSDSSVGRSWRKYMRALYAASAFIMVRSVFRVVEYISGNNGYILHHEVFLYVFDACLIFFVMVIFNVTHPGDLTGLAEKEYMSSQELVGHE